MDLFRRSLRTNDPYLQTNLYRRAVTGFQHTVGRNPTNRYPVLRERHVRLKGYRSRHDYVNTVLKRESGKLFHRAFVVSQYFAEQTVRFVDKHMDQHTVAILPPLFVRAPFRLAVCYKVRGRRLVEVSKEDQPDLVLLCFDTGPIIPIVRDADKTDTKYLNALLAEFYDTDGVADDHFFRAFL